MKRRAKSLLSLLLCLSLLLAAIPAAAVTQNEIDELEEERSRLESRREDVQTLLDSLQSDRDSVLAQKSALDEQSELLRQDILLLNEQIALYEDIISDKREEAESAKLREEEHYSLWCSRVRTMEEQGDFAYILFILRSASLSELISRIIDVYDILSYDCQLREEYLDACDAAEKALAEYEQVQQVQKLKQEELALQEAELEEKIAASGRLISQLEEDIEAYLSYNETVDAELERVQQLIDEKAEELRRQEEAAAAQNPNTGSTGGTVNIGNGYFAWPSYCTYVSSPFGPRVHPIYGQLKPHTGVDIAAAYGTAITAAASGTVCLAVVDYGSVGYGTYVAIYHSNGTTTLYAHMSALCVSVGQTVSQGQVIGYVGSTGASTGPHIHFEIRVNGACVDPMLYF